MIAAILRAQWLSMRLGGRGTAFNILVGLIWYGLWSGIATLLGGAAATLPARVLVQWLPVGFLGMFAYCQFVPVISASMGSALNLRKLLPYPIPHDRLFVIEVLLRLMNAIEMLMVLTGGVLGLLVNPETGGLAAVPGVAAAAVLFLLFNVLLASGLRSVLTRLFAMRKVRELMTLLVALVWVLPRVLVSVGLFPKTLGGAGILLRTVALPWNAAAHLALRASAALGLLSLVGWTLAALWFGRAQFERSLRRGAEEEESAPVRAQEGRTPLVERFYRLPGLVLRDPVAGIVEKELRSLARTPRFRTVFVMGFTFGLLVWFPLMFHEGAGNAASPHYLVIVCGYALILMGQVSYWNCFGFDRSATAFYFAAPTAGFEGAAGKESGLAVLHLPGGDDSDRRHLPLSPESRFWECSGSAGGHRDLRPLHAGAGQFELGELSAADEPGAGVTRRSVGAISGPDLSALSGGPSAGDSRVPGPLCLSQRGCVCRGPSGGGSTGRRHLLHGDGIGGTHGNGPPGKDRSGAFAPERAGCLELKSTACSS